MYKKKTNTGMELYDDSNRNKKFMEPAAAT